MNLGNGHSIGPPVWLADYFPPDRRAATECFRRWIDESMIREIAEADYKRDVDEHLSALVPVWQGEEWDELSRWYPQEVLELIRWSEPEVEDWKPGAVGLRGHRMRAFSCAVLLATSNHEGDKETLIQLLESALVMGDESMSALAGFLLWRIPRIGRGDDRPFFVLALIAIARFKLPDLTEAREEELAQWLAAEEADERNYLAGFRADHGKSPWLFGLSFSEMRNEKWEALLNRLSAGYPDEPLAALLTAFWKP